MILNQDSHGDTAVEDIAACEKAMTVLQKAYPEHPWLIGADHFAGMIHIRLQYGGSNHSNNGYGFMLKLSTVMGSDGEHKIRMAGGESLERYRLVRGAATEQSEVRALQNGLDLSNIFIGSKK